MPARKPVESLWYRGWALDFNPGDPQTDLGFGLTTRVEVAASRIAVRLSAEQVIQLPWDAVPDTMRFNPGDYRILAIEPELRPLRWLSLNFGARTVHITRGEATSLVQPGVPGGAVSPVTVYPLHAGLALNRRLGSRWGVRTLTIGGRYSMVTRRGLTAAGDPANSLYPPDVGAPRYFPILRDGSFAGRPRQEMHFLRSALTVYLSLN